jgi:GrpB-like predicted nucleotidyltransferase (UPF0157 family)
MKVTVEQYNPEWATQFAALKSQISAILSGVAIVGIEHVGSTSVVGLAAKPVLDIDIVVTQPNLEPATKALTRSTNDGGGGYEYFGEWGVPDRHAFRKYGGVLPKHNLYVCIEGSQSLRNHLLVRDTCRRDPEVRDAYGRKKMELAEKEWIDVDDYCEAKNEILQFILSKAGMGEEEREEIRKRNVTVR